LTELAEFRQLVRESLRSHGSVEVIVPGRYIAGLLRTTAHQQATAQQRVTTHVEPRDDGTRLFTAQLVSREQPSEGN
jgi:hypothetical protein